MKILTPNEAGQLQQEYYVTEELKCHFQEARTRRVNNKYHLSCLVRCIPIAISAWILLGTLVWYYS